MWTTLRFAPSCPHIHSPYFDSGFLFWLEYQDQRKEMDISVTLSFDRIILFR
jgi:hypothetical protein